MTFVQRYEKFFPEKESLISFMLLYELILANISKIPGVYREPWSYKEGLSRSASSIFGFSFNSKGIVENKPNKTRVMMKLLQPTKLTLSKNVLYEFIPCKEYFTISLCAISEM